MIALAARRAAASVLVLLGISVLAFALVRLVPGDTATAMLGTRYTEEDARALRARFHLDRPLPVQYAVWLGGVARGDLGRSTTGVEVAELVGDALPLTLQLAGLALLAAILVGVPLGVAAAVFRGRPADRLLSAAGLAGVSTPGFWLATVLILLFALELRWLPAGGHVPLHVDPAASLRSLLLPALALGAAVAGVLLRFTRAAVIETLGADHVRTARAKGLPGVVVLTRHALRPALIPVLTIAGIQAGYLLGGSIVIEQVFSLPGLGRLALDAIGRRDYPLLQAVILLVGLSFVAINLAVDLLYGWVDPRVRR